MGCFTMPKGVPNKRYTPEFKELVVETMRQEKLNRLDSLKSAIITGCKTGNESI